MGAAQSNTAGLFAGTEMFLLTSCFNSPIEGRPPQWFARCCFYPSEWFPIDQKCNAG